MKYQDLKQLAKRLKRPVPQMIALAPQNDPFHVGTPSDVEKGEWFATLWHEFGFESGIHLRRVHYQLVSQPEPVRMPDGKPYENTEGCWCYLCVAGKMARYLNLVAVDAVDDRRNPPPTVYSEFPESQYRWQIGTLFIDGEIVADLPSYPPLPPVQASLTLSQGFLIEIWCEKSTMNDVLIPLCQTYRCNLVTGLGELSLTACYLLLQRIRRFAKPARIVYTTDFDPAGQSMPVAVARKLEYLLQSVPGADVQLEQVALNQEQCQQYRLPRTPIKETERRGAKFQERYGEGATELDALEALHRGSLRQIVRAQIERFYDYTLDERGNDALDFYQQAISEMEVRVQHEFALEDAQIQAEYEQLRAETLERLERIKQTRSDLVERYTERITQEIEDVPVPELPQPAPAQDWKCPLFDSQRDYMEQLGHYRRFQGKPTE